MSIVHKAWPFDYDAFEKEFGPTLESALVTGDIGPIRAFIDRFHGNMWDGWEETPLTADWERVLLERSQRFGHKNSDAEWYGDHALTRYYRFDEEMGLGYSWSVLLAYLRTVPRVRGVAEDFVMGFPFGPEDHPFDPGKQGTGFMRASFVHSYHRILETTAFPDPPPPGSELYRDCVYADENAADALAQLRTLFASAVEANKGLMFTDFQ
jgi:hypothetical protein